MKFEIFVTKINCKEIEVIRNNVPGTANTCIDRYIFLL